PCISPHPSAIHALTSVAGVVRRCLATLWAHPEAELHHKLLKRHLATEAEREKERGTHSRMSSPKGKDSSGRRGSRAPERERVIETALWRRSKLQDWGYSITRLLRLLELTLNGVAPNDTYKYHVDEAEEEAERERERSKSRNDKSKGRKSRAGDAKPDKAPAAVPDAESVVIAVPVVRPAREPEPDLPSEGEAEGEAETPEETEAREEAVRLKEKARMRNVTPVALPLLRNMVSAVQLSMFPALSPCLGPALATSEDYARGRVPVATPPTLFETEAAFWDIKGAERESLAAQERERAAQAARATTSERDERDRVNGVLQKTARHACVRRQLCFFLDMALSRQTETAVTDLVSSLTEFDYDQDAYELERQRYLAAHGDDAAEADILEAGIEPPMEPETPFASEVTRQITLEESYGKEILRKTVAVLHPGELAALEAAALGEEPEEEEEEKQLGEWATETLMLANGISALGETALYPGGCLAGSLPPLSALVPPPPVPEVEDKEAEPERPKSRIAKGKKGKAAAEAEAEAEREREEAERLAKEEQERLEREREEEEEMSEHVPLEVLA
ncbi:hypothetical protein KIPB_008636, partial [Kipferlia bialata]